MQPHAYARRAGIPNRQRDGNRFSCTPQPSSAAVSPGGRHDNDFVNFREIAIYPTGDELLSTLRPFLPNHG